MRSPAHVRTMTPVAAAKAPALRRNPDNPRQVAIETGPKVTAGKWFLFDADNGGGYTDGETENIDDWTKV